MNMNLNDQQKKYLMIAGICIGAAALLTYPAMLLYRRLTAQKKESETEDTVVKSFAPSYRGNHKPHHRKAEANGHLQATS